MRYIPADDQQRLGYRSIRNGHGDMMAIRGNGSCIDDYNGSLHS